MPRTTHVQRNAPTDTTQALDGTFYYCAQHDLCVYVLRLQLTETTQRLVLHKNRYKRQVS
jgi:hypothetical protein